MINTNVTKGPFVVGETIVNDGINEFNYMVLDIHNQTTLLQELTEDCTEFQIPTSDFYGKHSKWMFVQ